MTSLWSGRDYSAEEQTGVKTAPPHPPQRMKPPMEEREQSAPEDGHQADQRAPGNRAQEQQAVSKGPRGLKLGAVTEHGELESAGCHNQRSAAHRGSQHAVYIKDNKLIHQGWMSRTSAGESITVNYFTTKCATSSCP
ncbi:hypothetical protein EYF80_043769 [Liparis tanakae]|uniref:Uncharacterized protein n=1 Tax=Liparis tanakae TaxID=230148 RepID=A0A4Z2FXM0_9TELE|nr:hypothetical protein EYF80_043769 [Liparis tanakae]